MTEENLTQDYENMLSSELKEAITEVKKALFELMPNTTEINTFETLQKEVIEKFISKHKITVIEKFKTSLNTPFALAKYLLFLTESAELCKEVNTKLNNLLDKEKVGWVIHKDLSNLITFTKNIPLNSDIRPQNLVVKYSKNIDEDTLCFSLMSGTWGWNISDIQLKNLLEDTSIVYNNKNTYKNSDIVSQISNNSAIINVNDIKIVITKNN